MRFSGSSLEIKLPRLAPVEVPGLLRYGASCVPSSVSDICEAGLECVAHRLHKLHNLT